ncbi:glycine zipper family protein [Noviherbaspirillum suwonense]|uniref:Glycine-zipper containing OmpA-like membrane domain-containing protein n=1 Tax=Noviherbaspirillum suwonense TaxID=1224511 RepID=A0ABY1PSG3_9BURK|nr:glycine zipper family protein [Noviherbaspirillum suwonense]SMP45556.1 Glycine-zipper containing OmpA-like membrane domain-containing protein [Noviherbaspirillum suwonense]
MSLIYKIVSCIGLLALAGCTTMPSGPNVMALPGNGKTFEQFRNDDFQCRQYAQSQLGGATPTTAMEDSGVRSAALGTLLGAAAGAAVNGGRGAAVGAGTGLAFGGLAGAGAGQASGYGVQRRYDYAYMQCMYAQGNRVPSAGGYASDNRFSSGYASPAYSNPSYVSPSYANPSYPSPPPPPPGPAPAPPPR